MPWLTGFDPRFEEALLVVPSGATPTLLAGPENLGRARRAMIEVEARLYPPFGLLGQDRSQTPELDEVLASAGVARGQRVGVLGWKYFGALEAKRPDSWFETPAFIIDTLRQRVGEEGRVVNANALLMDSSTRPSRDQRDRADRPVRVRRGDGVGGAEGAVSPPAPGDAANIAAVQSMGLGVLPHSCHTMLSTGARLSGLESPSGKIIERGDPLTTAVGYWGGLSSRVGWVVEDARELPADAADWVERLAMPYFACAAEWYETIGIGVAGGTLDALARRHLGDPFFNLILNPGHLIHLDEWMNTPVYPGSSETFRSGQADPVRHHPGRRGALSQRQYRGRHRSCSMRGAGTSCSEKFPAIADRVEARRAFMGDVLGIRLKPEVLPLSNLAAAYPPFLLRPDALFAIG